MPIQLTERGLKVMKRSELNKIASDVAQSEFGRIKAEMMELIKSPHDENVIMLVIASLAREIAFCSAKTTVDIMEQSGLIEIEADPEANPPCSPSSSSSILQMKNDSHD